MKTLYKLIIALVVTLVLSQGHMSSVHASEKIETTVLTIHHISYDYRFGSYIAVSNEDSLGHVWVIDIVQGKPYKQSSIEWLSKKYQDKKLEIKYVDISNDEADIISTKWVK